MSRVRDDARRNMRREFATMHADGAPVGSVLIAYSDGCVAGLLETGDEFTCQISSEHSRADHVPFMSGPFSYEQFESLNDYYGETNDYSASGQ